MKRVILLSLLALFIAGLIRPLPVSAQAGPRLSELRVRLWPEFDRTALLVIYEGTLSGVASFPAEVSLRIPASVPEPHVVAAGDTPTTVGEVEYQNAAEGDWRVITFQASGPSFQLEYYDALNRQGSVRTPSFTWPGDYPVDSLLIQMQQPPHTENLSIQPTLPESQTSPDDNLTYHTGAFGPLDTGETFTVQLNYSRTEDSLTVEMLSALQSSSSDSTTGTSAATTSQASRDFTTQEWLLLLAVAVGSFLLGAASMRLAINWQAARRRR